MKKHLPLLLLLATAWRLLFILIWGPLARGDSLGYENLAQNLLAGKGYVDTRPFQVNDASMIRTPGYPLFLAGIRALFPNPGLALILIQQLLGVMTVWLTYRIGVRLADEKTGFRAGLITALHPWLAIYGNFMMTETLFTFMLALAVLFLAMGIQKNSIGRLSLAGVVFGLAVLVRPAFLLFLLLLPVGLLVLFKKAGPALRFAMVFGASCFLALLPWIIWNHGHKGYTGLTSFSGVPLLTLVQPPPSFYRESDPFQKAIRDCYTNGSEEVPVLLPEETSQKLIFKKLTMPPTYLAMQSLRKLGYAQHDIDQRFIKIAVSYILRNPFQYVRLAGKEMLKLWMGYPLEWLGGKFSKRLEQNRLDGDRLIWGLKIFAMIGLGMLLIPLTAWGAWRIVRRPSAALILVMLIASITLVSGFFTASDLRFRLPSEPFIMLIILYGIRKDPQKNAAGHVT